MALRTPPPQTGLSRNTIIVGGVLLFHAAALWALQSGLLLRAAEVIVPVEILSQFIEPPKPTPPPPPPPPAPPVPPRQPVVRPKAPTPPPAPRPVAIPDPTPAPTAPTGVIAPPAPLPPIEQPVAPAPAPAPAPPPAPPAPPQIQLPSSDAAYLQNPSPVYPAISRRLGEQGRVLVRVLIGVNGAPERVEIKRSSGFERLDRAATEYVMKCRYVPGKVNGTVQAMWYEAPVNFVLE